MSSLPLKLRLALLLLSAGATTPLKAQASVSSSFEQASDVPAYTTAIDGNSVHWTGDTAKVATSLPANGASGLAGDDYIWISDDLSSTDRFKTTLSALPAGSTFSYNFHDRWNGTAGLSNFPDVAITDPAQTVILIADIFTAGGGTNWDTVTGTFSTSTAWRVWNGSVAQFEAGGPNFLNITTKTLATQAQINSVIGSSFVFQFGFEQINGGNGGAASGRETMAIDNFQVTPAPEPAGSALSVLGLALTLARRGRPRGGR